MVPASETSEESAPESPQEKAEKPPDRRDEREFLHDPKRAATAITKAKKRLEPPSVSGQDPPETHR